MIIDSLNQIYDLDISENGTVYDMKLSLKKALGKGNVDIMLYINGAVLDDNKIVKTYGIIQGSKINALINEIHVPKVRKPKPASKSSFGVGGLLGNPLTKFSIQEFAKNPEYYAAVLESNPHMKQAIENNPMLKHALNDPDAMKEHLEMLSSQDHADQMALNIDRMISHAESMPKGIHTIQRFLNDVHDPILNGADESLFFAPNATNFLSEKPFKPSETALPATLCSEKYPMTNAFFGALQLFSPNIPSQSDIERALSLIEEGIKICEEAGLSLVNESQKSKNKQLKAVSSQPFEKRFHIQIRQLELLGYRDKKRNIEVLQKANGNIMVAASILEKS